KMPLMVRLQAPRFFLVGDLVAISAVINNNTDNPMRVTHKLEVDGLVITGLYKEGQFMKGKQAAYLTVPANGEVREDWSVSVQKPGTARIKVTASGEKYADAMEKNYTVYDHGIEKFVSRSGKVRGND